MPSTRFRDMLAGLALVAFGAAYAAHGVTQYGLGTFANMRPGMFPAMVGSLMVVVGLVVLASALRQRDPDGAPEPVAWRALVTILGAMSVFAFAIGRIGLVPSIFLLTGIAALADDKLRPLGALLLASVISVLAVLIFRYALGFPIVLVRNPF